MNRRDGAIAIGAAVEGDLEFARHRVGEALAQKRVGNLPGVRPHIENFMARQARVGAGSHVADGVVAGFAARHADVVQHVHRIGEGGERHEVELHVLARGEVTFAAAAEIGNVGEALQSARP